MYKIASVVLANTGSNTVLKLQGSTAYVTINGNVAFSNNYTMLASRGITIEGSLNGTALLTKESSVSGCVLLK